MYTRNPMTQLSRREFTTLTAAAAAAPFALGQSPSAAALTAKELIDRITAQIGVPWKTDTVDGLKAGDPATVVAGVVTTAMATMAVLQQAVKAGANVVITSQPTFYARADARTPPAPRGPGGGGPPGGPPPAAPAAAPPAAAAPADPVFTAKNAFIDQRKLVIIRLSDHWRLREPDPLAAGLAKAMGWTKYQVPGDPRRYDVPALAVDALVAAIAKNLRASGGIRVVGDAKTSVRRIGLLPGSTPLQASLKMLPEVDAIVAGEVREWESVEYARDQVAAGHKKALILIGRVLSEDPGMQACADWLKTVISGLPVRHIAVGDPYWRPAR
jgi:putative NIF3 family GTP cyclohydrolase 1 type 2